MNVADKQAQNQINDLEVEKSTVEKLVEEFETEAAIAKETIKELEEKSEGIQKRNVKIEK